MSFAKGSQDWGGRRKENPEGAPRVTRQDVLDRARELGLQVKRDGLYGMSGRWLYLDGKAWRGLGNTNFRAVERMRAMIGGPDWILPDGGADAN